MNFFDDFKPKSAPRELTVKRSATDTDREYSERMKEAAVILQQLFLETFDPETCTRKELFIPKRSLWGSRKQEPSAAQTLAAKYLNKIPELKAAAAKCGKANDTHWWDTDPFDVIDFLLAMVCVPEYDKNIRIEDEFHIRMEDRGLILYLCEQLNLQNLVTSSVTLDHRYYHYSDSDADEMRRNLREWQNSRDYMMALDSRPVYSADSKTLYASGSDYVLSLENYLNQDYERNRLERSMYTSAKESSVVATSQSRRCTYLFEVAKIDLEEGSIKDMQSMNNRFVGAEGEVLDRELTRVSARNSMALASYYLGRSPVVKKVSDEYLEKLFSNKAGLSSFDTAIVLTCLAEKL